HAGIARIIDRQLRRSGEQAMQNPESSTFRRENRPALVRTPLSAAIVCITAAAVGHIALPAFAQDPVPAEQTAAAFADPNWKVPRFSWGDPNLEGTFTSRDMSGIQMERGQQYGTRESLTPEEFRQRAGGGGRGGLAGMRGGAEFEGAARLQLS